jgi:PIN domain nuclease of toxin-antitoxin system
MPSAVGHQSVVAELHAAVTDTHPLLFHAAGTGRLSPRAAALFDRCERREAIIYVPATVMWETAMLVRVGRVNLRRSVQEFFDDLFSNPAYQPLDTTPDHVYAADRLRFTRDPFDALIVGAAQVVGLALVTRDGPIRESGTVAIVW